MTTKSFARRNCNRGFPVPTKGTARIRLALMADPAKFAAWREVVLAVCGDGAVLQEAIEQFDAGLVLAPARTAVAYGADPDPLLAVWVLLTSNLER